MWSLTCVSVWTVRGEMLLVSVQPIRTQYCQEMKLNIHEDEGVFLTKGEGGHIHPGNLEISYILGGV